MATPLRTAMFSNLRVLAGRLLVLAIYLGLAFVGVVLLVWGFVFALAVAGGLLILFMLMRLFGVRRPKPIFRQPGQSAQPDYPNQQQQSSQKPAGVIDLQRRDDGSYE